MPCFKIQLLPYTRALAWPAVAPSHWGRAQLLVSARTSPAQPEDFLALQLQACPATTQTEHPAILGPPSGASRQASGDPAATTEATAPGSMGYSQTPAASVSTHPAIQSASPEAVPTAAAMASLARPSTATRLGSMAPARRTASSAMPTRMALSARATMQASMAKARTMASTPMDRLALRVRARL